MASEIKVALEKFVNEFELENLTPEIELDGRMLVQKFVNRPALQLTGFFDHFDNTRIQIIGRIEHTYMRRQTVETRIEIFDKLLSFHIPCIVFCRSLEPFPEMIEIADKYSVPIFKTNMELQNCTVKLQNGLTPSLPKKLRCMVCLSMCMARDFL